MHPTATIIFEALDLWPLAVSGLAMLTTVVIWIYPPQVRGNGALRWIPLALRWMALAALVVALLRPVILERNVSLEHGAVMVLVDFSKSMDVTDVGRTPARLVALAAALGRLPEGVRSAQAQSVYDDIHKAWALARGVLSAQNDLDYARVSGRGIAERQTNLQAAIARCSESMSRLVASAGLLPPGTELRARLLAMGNPPPSDAREAWSKLSGQFKELSDLAQRLQAKADDQLYAGNAQVGRECDALAKQSRLSLVQDALLDPRGGLVPVLRRTGQVVGYSFGSKVEPLMLEGTNRSPPWKASAPQTDLTGATAAALNLASMQPIKAIVLFSDGRQVGGTNDLTSAVRPSGVPAFTVDVSAPQVPDAWIQVVTPTAGSAFAGESIDGQIEVRCRDLAHLPDRVQIAGSLGRQEIALTPRPGRAQGAVAELTARYSMPVGPNGASPADKLVFTIATQSNEVTSRNNQVERWVKVSSEQTRVLLCAGAANWDFQYLRRTLSGQPWVHLDSVLLGDQDSRLLITARQILQHDVAILSDVPVAALDVNQWDAVNRLASDRGGSVVLVAGANNSINSYDRQPIAAALLPFHDLKPTWKQWPGERGAFQFALTPLGASEMPRLAEGSENLRRWQELPSLFQYLQLPEKNLYADVRELLLEADSGSPVLTERKLGDGQVYFLGLDETWRWRRPGATREPGRFWQQLVRRAAGEPYAVVSGPVSLDVNRVACEPGDVVEVRARIRAAVDNSAASTWPLEIVLRGKTVATTMLRSIGRGRFAGQLRDLREGDYQLQVRGTGRSSRSVAGVPLHVAMSDEAELRDVSGDSTQLNRIARSTGGEHLALDELDRLPARLVGLHSADSQFVRWPIYDSPLLFVFVLSCLAGEWALRKRYGLA
jgi:hypothetical protein